MVDGMMGGGHSLFVFFISLSLLQLVISSIQQDLANCQGALYRTATISGNNVGLRAALTDNACTTCLQSEKHENECAYHATLGCIPRNKVPKSYCEDPEKNLWQYACDITMCPEQRLQKADDGWWPKVQADTHAWLGHEWKSLSKFLTHRLFSPTPVVGLSVFLHVLDDTPGAACSTGFQLINGPDPNLFKCGEGLVVAKSSTGVAFEDRGKTCQADPCVEENDRTTCCVTEQRTARLPHLRVWLMEHFNKNAFEEFELSSKTDKDLKKLRKEAPRSKEAKKWESNGFIFAWNARNALNGAATKSVIAHLKNNAMEETQKEQREKDISKITRRLESLDSLDRTTASQAEEKKSLAAKKRLVKEDGVHFEKQYAAKSLLSGFVSPDSATEFPTNDELKLNSTVAIFVLGPSGAGKTFSTKLMLAPLLKMNGLPPDLVFRALDGGIMREESSIWHEINDLKNIWPGVPGFKNVYKEIAKPASDSYKEDFLDRAIKLGENVVVAETATVCAVMGLRHVSDCGMIKMYKALEKAKYKIILSSVNTDMHNCWAQGLKRQMKEGKGYSVDNWKLAQKSVKYLFNWAHARGNVKAARRNVNVFYTMTNNNHRGINNEESISEGAVCRDNTKLWVAPGMTVGLSFSAKDESKPKHAVATFAVEKLPTCGEELQTPIGTHTGFAVSADDCQQSRKECRWCKRGKEPSKRCVAKNEKCPRPRLVRKDAAQSPLLRSAGQNSLDAHEDHPVISACAGKTCNSGQVIDPAYYQAVDGSTCCRDIWGVELRTNNCTGTAST